MYRTLDTKFWTDPKVRKLSAPAKLLFLYLITNRFAHVSGIYCLPLAIVPEETGLNKNQVNPALDTLSGAGLVRMDQENGVVWVRNMMAYQARGEKNERAAAANLSSLHNSPLINEFLQKYPNVALRYAIPYPAQDQSGTPEQEQEQEQEKEKEQEKEQKISSEPASPSSEQIVVMTFPVTGSKDKPDWHLTNALLASLREDFPHLDVLDQCRQARAWCNANPTKRKTPAGMMKFLVGWLTRHTNDSRPNGKAAMFDGLQEFYAAGDPNERHPGEAR